MHCDKDCYISPMADPRTVTISLPPDYGAATVARTVISDDDEVAAIVTAQRRAARNQ